MKRKMMVLLGCVVFVALAYPGIAAHATTIAFYSDGVIQEGDVYDKVEVYDTPPAHTSVNMTGGGVGYPGMSTFDTSVVNISGGWVGFLETHDSSTVNISGGWVGEPDALGETTISELTAYGFDGTPIEITNIPDPSTNPNTNLVPEPGTWALMALGVLWV